MKKEKIRAIDFESTLKCTHNCVYCYNAHKNHSGYNMDELNTADTIAMLNKVIDQSRCNRFVLTGGEPFLRTDFRELIAAVHRKKVPITVITNGALPEEDDFKFCKKNGVDIFEITLLSADRNIHNDMARAKGDFSAFDHAVWASQQVVKHKLRLAHVFVVTKKNLKTIRETMELSYALGCRTFLFKRFNPGGEGAKHIDDLQCSPVELALGLKAANDFVKQHPTFQVSCAINIHPCLIDLKQFPFVKMTGCGVGENQSIYVVDMRGNIRLCSWSSTVVGNILESDFDDIIHSDTAKQFMAAHPDFCTGCDYLDRCQGGCKASADNCFGNACAEDAFLRKYKGK